MPSLIRRKLSEDDKSPVPLIGTVASFDEVSDIITEFYSECKYKKKIDSYILKCVVNKQHKRLEEHKFTGRQHLYFQVLSGT